MQENKKHYYNTQNTLRFTENELQFIDENYETIAETSERIPIKNFVIKAVTGAVSMVKPKEIVKEIEVIKHSEEHLQKIEELQSEIETLKSINKDLASSVPPAEAICLNFPPKWRKYIWAVLQISKKQGYAQTYEELLEKVFTVVNARNELVLTEEDLAYIDTLPYDLPNDPED